MSFRSNLSPLERIGKINKVLKPKIYQNLLKKELDLDEIFLLKNENSMEKHGKNTEKPNFNSIDRCQKETIRYYSHFLSTKDMEKTFSKKYELNRNEIKKIVKSKYWNEEIQYVRKNMSGVDAQTETLETIEKKISLLLEEAMTKKDQKKNFSDIRYIK